jgi:hypothetical protein
VQRRYLSSVDRVVERAADADVVEGFASRVQEHERGRALWYQMESAGVPCRELRNATGRDEVEEDVRAAVDDVAHRLFGRHADPPHDLVGVSVRPSSFGPRPKAPVTDKCQRFAGDVVLDRVRAG